MKANFRLITKQGRIQWLFREVRVHKPVTARFTQYKKLTQIVSGIKNLAFSSDEQVSTENEWETAAMSDCHFLS